MSMVQILIGMMGLMSVQSAFAADLVSVHVEVQRIVIDNGGEVPSVDFSTVCEVTSNVKFQDVRGIRGGNGLPDTLLNNCSFDFLGAKQSPTIWAGAGAYTANTANGPVDKDTVEGAFKVADDVSTVWGLSKLGINDIELVVDTPQRSAASTPKRKESLRVTYHFYK